MVQMYVLDAVRVEDVEVLVHAQPPVAVSVRSLNKTISGHDR